MFLDPQDDVGPSISSSGVLCFFFLLVYIVVLVLVVCLCPSSVRVVATFPGTVLFPLLCSVLQFFLPNKFILSKILIGASRSNPSLSLFYPTAMTIYALKKTRALANRRLHLM